MRPATTPIHRGDHADGEGHHADSADGDDSISPSAFADDSLAKWRVAPRGIHPEATLPLPGVRGESWPLQSFTPEEKKKVAGSIMLFCAQERPEALRPRQGAPCLSWAPM